MFIHSSARALKYKTCTKHRLCNRKNEDGLLQLEKKGKIFLKSVWKVFLLSLVLILGENLLLFPEA